jgi:hypothetical protein
MTQGVKRTLTSVILKTADPTLRTYERRIILLHFAAKTLQHQLPLSAMSHERTYPTALQGRLW